jgi:hypothetical protein
MKAILTMEPRLSPRPWFFFTETLFTIGYVCCCLRVLFIDNRNSGRVLCVPYVVCDKYPYHEYPHQSS